MLRQGGTKRRRAEEKEELNKGGLQLRNRWEEGKNLILRGTRKDRRGIQAGVPRVCTYKGSEEKERGKRLDLFRKWIEPGKKEGRKKDNGYPSSGRKEILEREG